MLGEAKSKIINIGFQKGKKHKNFAGGMTQLFPDFKSIDIDTANARCSICLSEGDSWLNNEQDDVLELLPKTITQKIS